jgi:hypothetical protein
MRYLTGVLLLAQLLILSSPSYCGDRGPSASFPTIEAGDFHAYEWMAMPEVARIQYVIGYLAGKNDVLRESNRTLRFTRRVTYRVTTMYIYLYLKDHRETRVKPISQAINEATKPLLVIVDMPSQGGDSK